MADLWHSTRWLQAVWESDLTQTQRHIAHIYAGFAGSGRTASTTEQVIAHRTGLTARSVRENRPVLVDRGWLTVAQEARGRRPAVYFLTIPDRNVLPVEGGNVVPVYEPPRPEPTSGHDPVDRNLLPRRPEPRSPKRSEEISNSSSSTNSPGRLARDVAALAGWDDDDERIPHLNGLAAHHGVTRPSGWLRTLAGSGDLDARMSEYLTLTQPKPRPARWRCQEPGHIGLWDAGDRCPRCVEEIRTGDRPEHQHGQRMTKEAS